MADAPSTLSQALSGSYRIDRELGRGGMAVVYLARDLKHDRNVALKVIRPDVSYPGIADRFAREIKLAARLQHPHILPVLDSGEAAGQLWYTMPFVEGETLRDRLDREKQLPIHEALRITREAAQALEYAHQHSVIHRDIKPENILLTKDGSVLVADFGIARAIAGPEHTTSATKGTTQLTETGVAMGTPAYMAPEQRLGIPADARSDIYSLAAVLSELVTGRMIGAGGRAGFENFLSRLSDTAPGMRVVRPEVSDALESAVRRALHPDPAQRFPSMQVFARALDQPVAPRPTGMQGGRRAMLALVAASVLVSAGLLFKALSRERGRNPSPVRTMVVLPFVDVSGDTAEAYFAQGMADELTTTLVQMSGVRLAGQSAVGRLKPEEMNARDAGRKLSVESVLEGTVRRSGQRLRVTAQLTNAADGIVLWAGRYDRDARDVFQVQDEITRAIATALQATLAEPGQQPLSTTTGDLEAYDLYLRGRYYWSKRGSEGLNKAIDFFGRAVQRDSSFARAHAGLSMAYAVLPIFESIDPDSAMRLSELSAAHALALDSGLAEAHLALAYTLKNRWRFGEAEREFLAARALAPNDAVVHHWYGVLLYAIGRPDESVNELTRARELDPFGSTIGTDAGIALYAARRFHEARREAERSYQLDSTKSDNWLVVAWTQLALGFPDSAIASLERSQRFRTAFDIRPYLSVSYRRLGETRKADSIAADLSRDHARGRALAFDVAIAASGAGDRSTALGAIESALKDRSLFVTEVSLPCDALFDPIRDDPRFEQMLASVGMRACPIPPPADKSVSRSP